ncbi:hypothetical protein B0H67DRAFT_473753 [Lasiosphaeris hirsuta]|uniref:DUF7082 domain-containing protein n=1 Tax=Lasiosphaeris hirsuta TaxID=260670 RepID=A0AA40E9Y0_9PEZI|nr:hypothetical protein B0H67DRAFT_473753 [Lasiosphaeris hirsuta]
MSTVKFEQPVYKVYEPGYNPHRTIILDEQIESPETITIRLEEAAARNGGGLSGDSPTGLLPMSGYKPQPPQLHGYAESPYSQYSAQSFSTQQSENAASQINQMAFAANNAATGQYLTTQAAAGPTVSVISCHPSSGSFGTKVSIKATSQYDIATNMSGSAPFVWVLFGSHRCAAQSMKESQDNNGTWTYTITAEAPQFLNTTCASLSNVPLTLMVESASGAEIARANNAGVFSYHDGQTMTAGGSGGVGGSGDTSPPELGSPKTRSPVQRTSPPHQSLPGRANTTSPSASHGLPSDTSTNTYGFPPSISAVTAAAQAQQVHQAQTHTQPDYVSDSAGQYNQTSSSMMQSYRSTTLSDQFSRGPPVLRSPHGAGWSSFGGHMDSIRSPATTIPHTTHSSITRPSLTPLQHPGSSAPQLFRTSTVSQQGAGGPGGGGYSPYGQHYQTKATLKIHGDLGSMAENWTQEEWENRRRLVLFKKQQNGSVLTTTFKPVSIAERPPNSICISCIWWEERQECFVTSVDTIHLLEQLVAAPNRFSVEEKNRIRRNLEGFHPQTVSKSKAESEEFFKVIMSFGNPKPRNIEKDVKVFNWKALDNALKKIIGKYSASTSTIIPPSNSSHLLTPVSMGGPYPTLPPTPGSASSAAASDPITATGYMSGHHHHHGDQVASPTQRPMSGGSSWAAYGVRHMSPALKTSSPIPASGLRISTLPAVYDSRGSAHSLTSSYSMPSASHHGSHHSQGSYSQPGVSGGQSHARSWDAYNVPDNYPPHSGHSHGQVYGSGTYGDGSQRA